MERQIVGSETTERHKRKVVHFHAHLKAGGRKFSGFLVNISAHGAGIYIKNDSLDSLNNCTRGSQLELEFASPTGGILCLPCKVKWLRIHNIPAYGLINSFGLEITAPPAEYTDFFKSLTHVF